MPNILIENASIVTVNDNNDVISPGYIFTEDDKIAALGPGSPPDNLRRQAGTLIDGTCMAVMPGMVNAHTHLFQIFLRGLADDKPLLEWLKAAIWPVACALTEEDAYLAGLVGFLENIRSGATAVVDHQYVHTDPRNSDGICRAAAETGIRLLLARGWADHNYHPSFLESPEVIISEMRRLLQTWQGAANGRIRIEFGPLIPWGCSDQTMRETYRLAQEWGLGTLDAMALYPEDVLVMACRGGAATFGQPDLIGSLESGKKADLVLVDLDSPFSMPVHKIPSTLVYSTVAGQVDTVVIDGRIVMRDKKITIMDEKAVLARSRAVCAQLFERAQAMKYSLDQVKW